MADVYELQERDSLSEAGAWSKVGGTVTVTGSDYSVMVPNTPAKFYRLELGDEGPALQA